MSRDGPEQGEIWFVDFDPVQGQEQAGQRPALVVSVNELNRTGLSMVVPGTSRDKRYPGRVKVPAGAGGLSHDTWFLCDQLRTVARTRLRRYIGRPDTKYLRQVVTQTTFFLRLTCVGPFSCSHERAFLCCRRRLTVAVRAGRIPARIHPILRRRAAE